MEPSDRPGDDPAFTRPDHPDIALLEKVLLEHLTQRPGMSMDESLRVSLGSLVDPKSGSWVGIQRAIGYLGIKSPEELTRRYQEVFRLGVFWLDGFIAGGHLERDRNEQEGMKRS